MGTKTAIENFKTIPYIKVEHLVDGRTVNLMPLWDGKNWHMWIPTPSGFMEGMVVETVEGRSTLGVETISWWKVEAYDGSAR